MKDERWELSIGVLCMESRNTQIWQKILDRKQKIKAGRNVVVCSVSQVWSKCFHDIYCCVIDLGLLLESFKGGSFLLNCAFRLCSCQFAWISSQVLPSMQKKPILEGLLVYRIGGKPGESQDQTMMIEAASSPVSCSESGTARILAFQFPPVQSQMLFSSRNGDSDHGQPAKLLIHCIIIYYAIYVLISLNRAVKNTFNIAIFSCKELFFIAFFLKTTVKYSCCYSVAKSCLTLCNPMNCNQASLSFTISWSLLRLMSIESVMLSNHPILCCPLLLLPPVFPSIRVFFSELALCQSIGASASASVLPMSIYCWFPLGLTGLISLQSKGLSRVFSKTTIGKIQFFGTEPS